MEPEPWSTVQLLASCHPMGSKQNTYEKPKKRAEGITIKRPVAMFTGRSRVFWRRPPQQKTVFPEKYW